MNQRVTVFHGKQKSVEKNSHFRADDDGILIDAFYVHAGCRCNASFAFSIEWLRLADTIPRGT